MCTYDAIYTHNESIEFASKKRSATYFERNFSQKHKLFAYTLLIYLKSHQYKFQSASPLTTTNIPPTTRLNKTSFRKITSCVRKPIKCPTAATGNNTIEVNTLSSTPNAANVVILMVTRINHNTNSVLRSCD